jgi:hypothetical protein
MATPKNNVQPRFRKPIAAEGYYRETSTGAIVGATAFAESLGAPATKATVNIHAAFAGNDASNDFPGAFANPDVARNLRVTFAGGWDGGNVTVVGVDQFGSAVTEVFVAAAGSAVVGVKVFASVTSATKGAVGAAADAASIGTGDKLGLTGDLVASVGELTKDGVTQAATWDATASGVTPSTNLPNGARVYAASYVAAL